MIPSGTIALWFGSIVTIPSGWLLCDGTFSTPDLRDSFVVPAGNSYSVNQIGGSVSHLHAIGTAHSHFCPPIPLTVSAGVSYSYETAIADPGINTNVENHLPPFYSLPWIMKI